MLEKMSWNSENLRNDIDKIERITTSLRSYLSQGQSSTSANNQYWTYWSFIAERNLFICTLLLNKLEKIYGADDICITQGRQVVQKEQARFSIDEIDNAGWHLLSEIETQNRTHIIEYTRYICANEKLSRFLRYLQYSPYFADDVVFFIYTCCIAENEFRKTVLNALNGCRWIIDKNDLHSESTHTMLNNIIARLWGWNDISGLLGILEILQNVSISKTVSLSLPDLRDCLLTQVQPLSMMLYRKILQREGFSAEGIIDELYNCTYWATHMPAVCVNDFLFFAYAVEALPEKYDELAALFDTNAMQCNGDEIEEERISQWSNLLLSENGRWFNYRLIDKPFYSLIKTNPSRAEKYLQKMSSLSLYDISKSMSYRKNQTWIPNNFLTDYKQFLTDYAKSHSKSETIDLYMSSPLKAQVDFSYLIRMLYRPQEGFVYLTDDLDRYLLRGQVIKKETTEKNLSFQVSVSNVASSYRFPIHHSWLKYHYDEVEQIYNDGVQVYFKIMSLNSKGMIFTYDLVRKPRISKSASDIGIETKAVKYLDKIIDESLPLQGDNVPEDIRISVLALICDEDKVLVERKKYDTYIVDSLPILQVSNKETTDVTMRRLLKYFLGFFEDLVTVPCGIRHICIGNNKRHIIFIYKIQISDCLEKQKNLVIKQSMNWRDIEEYRANVTEKVSESILFSLDCSWSELNIIFPDNHSESQHNDEGTEG